MSMRRSSLTLSFVIFAALAISASAQAAKPVDLPTPATPSFGPTLAGNSVVYGSLDYTYDANANRYGHLHAWRTTPTGGVTDLAYFESSNVERRMDLAAGPEAFAVGFSELDDCVSSDIDSAVDGTCSVSSTVVAGPLAGGVATWSCFPHIDQPNDVGAPSFTQPLTAVSGPNFVRPVEASSGCGPQSRIVVSNALMPDHDTFLPIAAKSLLGVAISGDTLVLANRRSRNGFAIVSYDLAKGRLNYQRIFTTPNFRYRVGLDVDKDGTVAIAGQFKRNSHSSRSLCKTRQAVVLLDETGKPSCQIGRPATLEVKIAAGKVAYYTGSGKKNSFALLIARDVGDGSWRSLRQTTRWLHEPFDFDGKRLTWIDQGCGDPKVRLTDITWTGLFDASDCTP